MDLNEFISIANSKKVVKLINIEILIKRISLQSNLDYASISKSLFDLMAKDDVYHFSTIYKMRDKQTHLYDISAYKHYEFFEDFIECVNECFITLEDAEKSLAGISSILKEDDFVTCLQEDVEAAIKYNVFEREELQKMQESQSYEIVNDDVVKGRISTPQRALFALLLSRLYPDGDTPNTNAVKEAVNTELKKIGHKEVSYNTIASLMKK